MGYFLKFDRETNSITFLPDLKLSLTHVNVYIIQRRAYVSTSDCALVPKFYAEI